MATVIDLRTWEWAEEEPSGESDKQWLEEPETGAKWLFKPIKPHRSQDEAASEFAASRVAELLGVPAARVELGTRGDLYGCVSRNVVSNPTHGLVEGAIFIGALHVGFDPSGKENMGHNAANIAAIMNDLEPPEVVHDDQTAASVFSDFLLMDALIGNTDRHSKNWAVETSLSGRDRLAPSFDHATSLGITTRGDKRHRLLQDPAAVRHFCHKAYAHRFEGGQRTTLVDFAVDFLMENAPERAAHWENLLERLNLQVVADVVASSRMSAPAATMAEAIVHVNRERILTCLSS